MPSYTVRSICATAVRLRLAITGDPPRPAPTRRYTALFRPLAPPGGILGRAPVRGGWHHTGPRGSLLLGARPARAAPASVGGPAARAGGRGRAVRRPVDA